MLFDEKQMLEICKKYGIETVEKEGYPLYQGKEMDESFSISEIMHEPVKILVESTIHSSKSICLTMPVSKNDSKGCNFYDSKIVENFSYDSEKTIITNTSSISSDNQNKYAA